MSYVNKLALINPIVEKLRIIQEISFCLEDTIHAHTHTHIIRYSQYIGYEKIKVHCLVLFIYLNIFSFNEYLIQIIHIKKTLLYLCI